MQSSGVTKEQKRGKKGGGKGKKKSFDVVQSSNPKQKYHQQRNKSEKNTSSSMVDKQHKQMPPLLVTVSEAIDSQLQSQSDLPTSPQKGGSELYEENEEQGTSMGDGITDKDTEPVDGMRTSEGDQVMQRHVEGKETELVTTDEGKVGESQQLPRSPPDTEQEQEATAQVFDCV